MGSLSPPLSLSAGVKGSFAYKTVKDRLPIILTKVIDTVHRHKHEVFASHGEEGGNDLKDVIHCLSELRYRLTTDKPLIPLVSQKPDAAIWNAHLQKLEQSSGTKPTWYTSSWLNIECYFYRKVYEAFEVSRYLREWDPFRYQKEQAFFGAQEPITVLAEHLKTLVDECGTMSQEVKQANVENLLQISLWGNKCDLSISVGEQVVHSTCPLKQVDTLRDFILANDIPAVLSRLFNDQAVQNRRIDIILDNAGLELFGDLCLAEFLLATGLCDQVVFHVKAFPWFISDTTCPDMSWTMEMLLGSSSATLQSFGTKWQQRFDQNTFQVKTHPFWTLPYGYTDMPQVATDLWSHFNSGGLLAIFKGDLNYRKLVGDLNWSPTAPFDVAVQAFRPTTPFVALRTLKADVVTGLKDGVAESLNEKDPKWMISGDYAVVQYFCSK